MPQAQLGIFGPAEVAWHPLPAQKWDAVDHLLLELFGRGWLIDGLVGSRLLAVSGWIVCRIGFPEQACGLVDVQKTSPKTAPPLQT